MAKFDEDLNQRLVRGFKNFNAKVRYNKTKTRGRGMLPQTQSLREFKLKYSDKPKAEIEKQLKLLESFGSRDSLSKVSDKSRISNWELNVFKANYNKTLKFYDEEIADLERIVGDKPEYFMKQHNRLQNLQDKRKFLQRDPKSLSEVEIKIMRGIYNYAERSELTKRRGFKTYLNQLDRLLTLRNVPKSQRDAFINKFNVLTENEFTEMTRNEDLIDRVYELVYSPKERGEYELTVDDANADAIIQELFNNVDTIIANYKTSK